MDEWQSFPKALKVWYKNPLWVTIAIFFSLRVHNLHQFTVRKEKNKLKTFDISNTGSKPKLLISGRQKFLPRSRF
jgi:hypothetical protein